MSSLSTFYLERQATPPLVCLSRMEDAVQVMFLRAVVFILLLCIFTSPAISAEIINQSSDSRYQARTAYYIDPNNVGTRYFHISIFDTKLHKVIYATCSGYDAPHGTDELILWSPSLPMFAIRVADSRRYGHTELYSISKHRVAKLQVPDYQQSALKKANVIDSFNVMFDHFGTWNQRDLQLDLTFNAKDKNTNNYAGRYNGKVVLRVQNTRRIPIVKLHLVSVKPE